VRPTFYAVQDGIEIGDPTVIQNLGVDEELGECPKVDVAEVVATLPLPVQFAKTPRYWEIRYLCLPFGRRSFQRRAGRSQFTPSVALPKRLTD